MFQKKDYSDFKILNAYYHVINICKPTKKYTDSNPSG